MKANLLSVDNQVIGKVDLPKQFEEPVRQDLIKRAVLAIQANNRQPYGTDPEAGKNTQSASQR
jgi:large subunit ribosomal protein L4e